MKKKFTQKSIILLILLSYQTCFAGLLFDVSSTIFTLTIKTTIPNKPYSSAGIKINTPHYALSTAGIDCTDANSGYCLFSVSDTKPKTISIIGVNGIANITLCLDGAGPFSCQNYNIHVGTGTITAVNGSNIDPAQFYGDHLNYLGTDGASYEWMEFHTNQSGICNNGDIVSANYSVGATNIVSATAILFGSTDDRDIIDPASTVAVCPTGSTKYNSAICTNCLYVP